MLSNSAYEEYFCKIHAIYERKVGLDPRDKELYVFEEILDSNWVSFKDLINSTGGLIRIPFLMSSQGIMHIIKFWLNKILKIVDVCHEHGAALHVLRPDNFFINIKTLEIKVKSLRGACKITSEGKLELVSDLDMVLKDEYDPNNPFNKAREEKARKKLKPGKKYQFSNWVTDLQKDGFQPWKMKTLYLKNFVKNYGKPKKSHMKGSTANFKDNKKSQLDNPTKTRDQLAAEHLKMANASVENSPFKGKQQNKHGDPYLAPEFFYGMEHSSAVDSWALGNFIFFLIFGEEPKPVWKEMGCENIQKSVSEPSEYSFYDYFGDDLLNDIIKYDYNLEPTSSGGLQRAISAKSFTGAIEQILSNKHVMEYLKKEDMMITSALNKSKYSKLQQSFTKESQLFGSNLHSKSLADEPVWLTLEEMDQSNTKNVRFDGPSQIKTSKIEISDVLKSKKVAVPKKPNYFNIGYLLDMITTLLDWNPLKRPTAKSILHSPLLKFDHYENVQMKQYASIAFFYRSPSKCVRERILLPLREICAQALAKPDKILSFSDEIMELYKLTLHLFVDPSSFCLAEVSKEVTSSNFEGKNISDKRLQSDFDLEKSLGFGD
jgi:serine/threonine protein kinase